MKRWAFKFVKWIPVGRLLVIGDGLEEKRVPQCNAALACIFYNSRGAANDLRNLIAIIVENGSADGGWQIAAILLRIKHANEFCYSRCALAGDLHAGSEIVLKADAGLVTANDDRVFLHT
jgi:hypothetical protein